MPLPKLSLPALPGQLKRLLPLVFALVAGLIMMVLVRRYLEQERVRIRKEVQREVMAQTQQRVIDVVVAAQAIPEGTLLEMSHVAKGTLPEEYAQPYVARHPRDIVGKVTMAPISQNEQIMTTKLRAPEEVPVGSTLSSITPKGKRAVTILVETINAVGGLVRPGDLIDILWSVPLPDPLGKGQTQLATFTLFQDVSVLAVGYVAGGKGQEAMPAQFPLTLALTPQETSFLLFASQQGKIQLSLRTKADGGTQVAVVPASISSLLEMQLNLKTSGSSEGPVQQPTTRDVEVYRGLEHEVVTVPEESVEAKP